MVQISVAFKNGQAMQVVGMSEWTKETYDRSMCKLVVHYDKSPVVDLGHIYLC
ncbi:MAG: hypothetical protein MUO63_21065 [Desulfobulbaceae bacterium]|nr:hypothetical protein [Desulfobulbaceae bacterium]